MGWEKIKQKGFEKKEFYFNLIWVVFCQKCPDCHKVFYSTNVKVLGRGQGSVDNVKQS